MLLINDLLPLYGTPENYKYIVKKYWSITSHKNISITNCDGISIVIKTVAKFYHILC